MNPEDIKIEVGEPDDIRNVSPEELARRNAAAQEIIAKSKERFERMQRARAPLPTGLSDARTLALLHGGLRERVVTSVFGQNWKPTDHRLILPCFRDPPPLTELQAAALITFLHRNAMARAGQLAPRHMQQKIFDQMVEAGASLKEAAAHVEAANDAEAP